MYIETENKKRKHRMLRRRASWLAMVLAGLLCVSLAVFIPEKNVEAYDEVNDIAITVGYWGGSEYTKKQATLSELASACGVNDAVYTWINAGYAPGTTQARGIYLYDIMQYCGIDMGSVYYYNFYTNDGATYDGARQQWTSEQLFSPRYTYVSSFYRIIDDYYDDPEDVDLNPERHFTLDNVFDYSNSEFTSAAWNDREEVEPMLALETRSDSWRGYTPQSDLDFTHLSTTGRPVLMFGQAGRNDITRNLQAQMVFKIHIWFDGSPKLSIADTSGKVGSTTRVSISTPDGFLTEQVKSRVTFTSSNSHILEVDNSGNVKIVGEGKASITAVYDGKNIGSVTVTGTGDGNDDSGKGDGSGNGNGKGNGKGSGKGNGKGGSGTGSGTRKTSQAGASQSNSNTGRRAGTDRRVVIPSNNQTSHNQVSSGSEAAGSKQQGSGGGSGSVSSDPDETIYEITQEAEKLNQSPAENKLFRWVLLAVGIALLTGATGQAAVYRNEVSWVKRAKKVYEKT